jgi:phosphohistidine phosphatase
MTPRTILLLRHAKSSWDDPSLADFDRPLSPRGEKAAPRIGAEMSRRGWAPGVALVSPAARTRATWALIAPHLPEPPEAIFPDRLYMADPDYLLSLLREAPWQIETLLVVGHNPGLQDFASLLASEDSDIRALDRMRIKFPTAALARFEFEGEWGELAPGGARLTDFLRPRDIATS